MLHNTVFKCTRTCRRQVDQEREGLGALSDSAPHSFNFRHACILQYQPTKKKKNKNKIRPLNYPLLPSGCGLPSDWGAL